MSTEAQMTVVEENDQPRGVNQTACGPNRPPIWSQSH